MKVYRSSLEARGKLTSSAVAIGNFDGVHQGHVALFEKAISLSKEEGGETAALTFTPHPARYFNPDLAPPLINTMEQKLELMAASGLDAVIVEPFNAELAALPPREFVSRVLVERLAVRHVVVGRNFLFGKKRAGDLAALQELGQELGYQAHGIASVNVQSIPASSTKVREFLLMGRVIGAAVLMGREYSVEGRVVRGKGRGRTIGIPTANIHMDNEILPRRGVYAGRVRHPDGRIIPAVINIGTNPTFEKAAVLSFEVHLLDFSEDIYSQRLVVMFTQRLRDERRFGSVDELVAAIGEDITVARELLA